MRRVAPALIAAVALAAPAAADASRSYLNSSSTNGGYAVQYGHTIKRFELYCDGGGFTQTAFSNTFVFTLRDVVSVYKGHFSYSGYAFRYGNARQPRGKRRVKVSGRVTSHSLRAKWHLPGCGRGSITAART